MILLIKTIQRDILIKKNNFMKTFMKELNSEPHGIFAPDPPKFISNKIKIIAGPFIHWGKIYCYEIND